MAELMNDEARMKGVGEVCSAPWLSESSGKPPAQLISVDDTISADDAYRLASEGVGLVWRGDFQNAKHLLQALVRRLDRPSKKSQRQKKTKEEKSLAQLFHANRLTQSQRQRILGMVLIPINADYSISLRRAPDIRQACLEAFGLSNGPCVRSLRELLGAVGAHEWRVKGVPIVQLQVSPEEDVPRIYPHYGVFSPIRGEYLDLVAKAPLPAMVEQHSIAMDVGVGTGVISAILAKRGVQSIIATDRDPRAIACAQENFERLGIRDRVQLSQVDMFEEAKVALLVCNPPWVPAKPSTALDHAIYDHDSIMLQSFLKGAKSHLLPGGEVWLILSDLAERLGLRTREALLGWMADAGLHVLDRLDIRPMHKKALDSTDPLHLARSAEITSLWRLGLN